VLDSIYEEIYQESIVPDLKKTCISQSGGLDSRYALALLWKHGDSCDAYTFGRANSQEVVSAKEIALRGNVITEVFDFQTTDWEAWDSSVKRLGAIGTIQWSGWADEWLRLLARKHESVLIGYLGDALSGKHLVSESGHDEDWLKTWFDWSFWFDRNPDGLPNAPILTKRAQRDIVDAAYSKLETCLKGLVFSSPHQAAMHLDLVGRQRRWISSQINLASDYLHPKAFFCNQRLIDFWCNLPFSDLQNQNLYLRYAESRFPKFFKSRGAVSALLSKIFNKLKHFNPSYSPPIGFPIDREKIVLQNIDKIKLQVQSASRAIHDVVDVDELTRRLDTYAQTNSINQDDAAMVLRLSNLTLLAK
jgi:hypothetical protein